MMFIRRDRTRPNRLVAFRVGLFFFAAGLWIAGVTVGNDLITAIAIGVAAIALLVGMVVRRRVEREEDAGNGEGSEPQEH